MIIPVSSSKILKRIYIENITQNLKREPFTGSRFLLSSILLRKAVTSSSFCKKAYREVLWKQVLCFRSLILDTSRLHRDTRIEVGLPLCNHPVKNSLIFRHPSKGRGFFMLTGCYRWVYLAWNFLQLLPVHSYPHTTVSNLGCLSWRQSCTEKILRFSRDLCVLPMHFSFV